jgi:hypothetical protein
MVFVRKLSTQCFSVLACAFGAIIAGTVANRVTHDGASLFSFRYLIAGFDILCLVLFVSPLLVFSGRLMEAWRQGSQEYGALARYIGREMENKWLNREVGSEALEANDFSATVDFCRAMPARSMSCPWPCAAFSFWLWARCCPLSPSCWWCRPQSWCRSWRDCCFKGPRPKRFSAPFGLVRDGSSA